jgi:hypothetical protein
MMDLHETGVDSKLLVGLPYFFGPTQDLFLKLLKSLNSLLQH